MFLIYNPTTKDYLFRDSIDGMAFGKDEHIEIHCDKKRGKVYEKSAGVAMKSVISEAAILSESLVIVEVA